jgi:addiction module HigA family antidote
MAKKLAPITPGEILLHEFMEPLGVSPNKLARDIDAPVGRVSEIIRKNRAFTPDTAIRFSIYFGTTAEFWMNLQSRYDLKKAREELLPALRNDIRPISR